MPIIAKEGSKKEFFLIPAGTYQSVCYDLWDLGLQEGDWKGKKIVRHRIRLAWEINELIEKGEYQGKRLVVSKAYTLSLDSKATLRKDLESWRGRAFTKEELLGFDIEKLIGINAMLSIVHVQKDEKTFANVATVSKAMKGMEPLIPENKRSIPDWIQKVQARAVKPVEIVEIVDESPLIEEEGETPF